MGIKHTKISSHVDIPFMEKELIMKFDNPYIKSCKDYYVTVAGEYIMIQYILNHNSVHCMIYKDGKFHFKVYHDIDYGSKKCCQLTSDGYYSCPYAGFYIKDGVKITYNKIIYANNIGIIYQINDSLIFRKHNGEETILTEEYEDGDGRKSAHDDKFYLLGDPKTIYECSTGEKIPVYTSKRRYSCTWYEPKNAETNLVVMSGLIYDLNYIYQSPGRIGHSVAKLYQRYLYVNIYATTQYGDRTLIKIDSNKFNIVISDFNYWSGYIGDNIYIYNREGLYELDFGQIKPRKIKTILQEQEKIPLDVMEDCIMSHLNLDRSIWNDYNGDYKFRLN